MPVGPIVGLRPADLAQLESLLGAHHLPYEDCAEQVQIFCGVFDGGELIAAGGLEPAAEYALLRSIVVQERYRARGLARSISEWLRRQAEAEGRVAIYLLTETAEDYFAKQGFEKVARDAVPAAIMRTRQFSSLCPDSASCMRMTLPRSGS
ncbi:MAG: GNAT family N-acetyltransferase [Gammaproteobacteria bacterium]|nr:GNAT family N-acetyltransferase [Gammaproteobacteria bacterium]